MLRKDFKVIEPKIVKGFRDFLPDEEQKRQILIERLVKVFKSFNYQTLDTPVLEYAETLLGKSGGETEKQIFRFIDNGGRDVALRFDLTVPFARYLAMHKEELGLPFRRYHMAKVWRGEKPQKGRYREFMQCDFDIVGSDSLQADLDILLTAYSVFKELGLKVKIHYNDRRVFRRFLVAEGLDGVETPILQAVDKLDKVGEDKVLEELNQHSSPQQAKKVLAFVQSKEHTDPYLSQLEETLQQLQIADGFVFNPTITRGLDYYTGLVFETFLDDLPAIGSVCSGGRYDNLVSLYSKEGITGMGGSVGLDRLIAALEELQYPLATCETPKVLIIESPYTVQANRLALALRKAGVPCEIYPNSRKMDSQFKYADRINAPYSVVVKEESYTLRTMATREQQEGLSLEELVESLKGEHNEL